MKRYSLLWFSKAKFETKTKVDTDIPGWNSCHLFQTNIKRRKKKKEQLIGQNMRLISMHIRIRLFTFTYRLYSGESQEARSLSDCSLPLLLWWLTVERLVE